MENPIPNTVSIAASRLFDLGLKTCDHGVLSGWGALELVERNDEYCGLKLSDSNVKDALKHFAKLCEEIGDMDLTI